MAHVLFPQMPEARPPRSLASGHWPRKETLAIPMSVEVRGELPDLTHEFHTQDPPLSVLSGNNRGCRVEDGDHKQKGLDHVAQKRTQQPSPPCPHSVQL